MKPNSLIRRRASGIGLVDGPASALTDVDDDGDAVDDNFSDGVAGWTKMKLLVV